LETKLDLKETLEFMVKDNYSNLSVTSIDSSIYIHGIKGKKYSLINHLTKGSLFGNFLNEITTKCSFKYPDPNPQDGKIIERINSSECSFVVILLSLSGNGTRVDFARI
jgi:hypothetical protein